MAAASDSRAARTAGQSAHEAAQHGRQAGGKDLVLELRRSDVVPLARSVMEMESLGLC